jgi:hypothetical protein
MFATTPKAAMRAMRRRDESVPLEEVVVVGRRTGIERKVLVTMLRTNDRWYIGHPNGDRAQWVRNLKAAGSAIVKLRDGKDIRVTSTLVTDPAERELVVAAAKKQPFPGGALYRAAGKHVLAGATYFRLEPVESDDGQGHPA